jgi:hypothetical protein
VFGLALDRFGPRATATSGIFLSVAGNWLMSISDSGTDKRDWFTLGYCLIAAGGIAPFLSAFSFARLFDFKGRGGREWRLSGLFVALNPAGLALSGMVYMVPNIFHWTRAEFFDGYMYVCVACGVLTFLFYPDNAPEPGEPCLLPVVTLLGPSRSDRSEALKEGLIRAEALPLPDVELGHVANDDLSRRADTKPWYLQSAVYEHSFNYAVGLAVLAFVMGYIPGRIEAIGDGELLGIKMTATSFTSYVIPVISNSVFLTSPICDWVIKRWGKRGFAAGGIATQALAHATLFSVFYFDSLNGHLITLVFLNIFHGFLFTIFFGYIEGSGKFARSDIGSCIAMGTAIAALVGFTVSGIPFAEGMLKDVSLVHMSGVYGRDVQNLWVLAVLAAALMPGYIFSWRY